MGNRVDQIPPVIILIIGLFGFPFDCLWSLAFMGEHAFHAPYKKPQLVADKVSLFARKPQVYSYEFELVKPPK
jgi:hypothetical protein